MKKLIFILSVLGLFSSCVKDDVGPASIEYPIEGNYGLNILDTTKTDFDAGSFGEYLSLAADLSGGSEVKIQITHLDSVLHPSLMTWAMNSAKIQNWNWTDYDSGLKTQIFTSLESGENCDLELWIFSGNYRIDYFEFGSDTITRSKEITLNEI